MNFPMQTQFGQLTVGIEPVYGTERHVGQLYWDFDGRWEGDERVQKFRVIMPMDRRQARRVSRRMGIKFHYRDGEMVWR